jgi:hypothetical protein
VPFLGRIPLIGEAFKVRNAARGKSNLMVFIRPRILRDGMQTAIETNSKYNAIRNEQLRQGQRRELIPLLPFDRKPELPPAQPIPDATQPEPTQGDRPPGAGSAATPPAQATEERRP